jgi:deoxyribose-phosphate aldolase
MQWIESVNEYINALKPITLRADIVHRLVNLIDLTRLDENDSEANIAAFCQKAMLPIGNVAAICVYPQYLRLVADNFASTDIKAATVINFPQGDASLEATLIEINQAIDDGADEIDLVFPYKRFLAGDREYAQQFVATCKAACGKDITLKVILETGALNDPAVIADAASDALLAGADFIKTSTGKIAEGATPEAVATILLVIKQLSKTIARKMGVKVSGGVRTLEQAVRYVELAEAIMGRNWVTPQTFRIGASKLVEEIERFNEV